MADLRDDELVYVPARPWPVEGQRQIALETRQTASGKHVGLVFSSVERLVEALGDCQPWVLMPVRTLRSGLGRYGVAEYLVDPQVPRECWRWESWQIEQLTAGDG